MALDICQWFLLCQNGKHTISVLLSNAANMLGNSTAAFVPLGLDEEYDLGVAWRIAISDKLGGPAAATVSLDSPWLLFLATIV